MRLAVRLGPQRHARADRLHEARREGVAEGTPRRASLRPRASGRAAARDARGHPEVPGGPLKRYNLSGELPTRPQDAEPDTGRVRDGVAVRLDDQALAPLRGDRKSVVEGTGGE